MTKPPQIRPLVLIILDGWGYSENPAWNAIREARKPCWDKLWSNYPHTLIDASGTRVGLPGDQMGNSEVGHMNIGSGRVIRQEFSMISAAIEDGSFFSNPILNHALKDTVNRQGGLHILGLVSPGGVHSHQDHIAALVRLAARCGLERIYLHAFLDGRDTPPRSAGDYLREIEARMAEVGRGRIASITGRYYAMDRNNNWERTRIAFELITSGRSGFSAPDVQTALAAAYGRGETDEFVKPTGIPDGDGSAIRVQPEDLTIYANFRADRARQLSRAFTEKNFQAFPRDFVSPQGRFISMTSYKEDFDFPAVFPKLRHKNVLGEYLANLGLRQLRIAETEKYAHVTFFFNGGEEVVFDHEDRILVPSPAVPTYDLKPEMSAFEVADKIVEAIRAGTYDVIIANFANADMVGHTGILAAAVRAIEALDQCLVRIVEATLRAGGELLITSDHGNAEKMLDDSGEKPQPHTAHTSNLVPLIYVGRKAEILPGVGALCDLAPTMLYLMDLAVPPEMTGRRLLQLHEPEIQTVAAG